MKLLSKIGLIVALVAAMPSWAQFTPQPQAGYVFNGSAWVALSGGDSGGQSYTGQPQPVGIYTNNNGVWTPWNGSSSPTSGSTPIPNNQLLSGGGVVWTGNLNFTVSAATYQISTNQYSSPQTNLTLTAADPTNPRIDAIVVDTTGSAVVVTGTPAATPAAPSIDATSQLQLTTVLVPANSSTPSVTSTNLYIDNAEWTCTSTAQINCASTNNPYSGTFDIEATTAAANDSFTLTIPASNINLSNYSTVSFYIRNKATWPAAKAIAIQWRNGSAFVGTQVSFKNGVYGYNQANTTTYQQIVIPTSAFGAGVTTVTGLKFTATGGGGTFGWYMDNIVVQNSLSGGGSGQYVTTVTGTTPITVSGASNAPNVTCPTCAVTVASGTAALGTGAISSGTCATVVTSTATGTLTTDVVTASFNGDPTGVTGYAPSANGTLTIVIYPTANTFNAKVCNNTAASITPGAITLNWRVSR